MQKSIFRQETVERRLDEFVAGLVSALGHADRVVPFTSYFSCLFGDAPRKSVEPMAAQLAPATVSATQQSLLHFVGQSTWSDEAVLGAIRGYTLPVLESAGGIRVWMVDDTGMVKKGTKSVGVARQYCGRIGKQENCQVAVSLSVASEDWSLPIGYRLYLPETWASDRERREKAHIPEDVVFKTKPEIALDQIRWALAEGVPKGVVLADAGYGDVTDFRDELTALELTYAVGIRPGTSVWPEGKAPLPPKRYAGRGARPHRLRRDAQHQPISVRELAMDLPHSRFRTISWREGTAGTLRSRFAAIRVRPAHRDTARDTARDAEWLLIEWPSGDAEPTKYFLATLPADMPLRTLVRTVKLRWRIERDYEELKSEIGLAHYEGRGWIGFHHHATLCIAAFAFLAAERGRFPPGRPRTPARLKTPALPRGFRPRGSPAPSRTPQSRVDRLDAASNSRPARGATATLPLMPQKKRPSNIEP